jgi:hypothetical protein
LRDSPAGRRKGWKNATDKEDEIFVHENHFTIAGCYAADLACGRDLIFVFLGKDLYLFAPWE